MELRVTRQKQRDSIQQLIKKQRTCYRSQQGLKTLQQQLEEQENEAKSAHLEAQRNAKTLGSLRKTLRRQELLSAASARSAAKLTDTLTMTERKAAEEQRRADTAQRQLQNVTRKNALLTSRTNRAKFEAARATDDAKLARLERVKTERELNRTVQQMTQQNWLVAELLTDKNRQKEEIVAAEDQMLQVATDAEEARQTSLHLRREARVSDQQKQSLAMMLHVLTDDCSALKRRLQQQQTTVAELGQEKENLECQLKVLQEIHGQHLQKLSNLEKELEIRKQEVLQSRAESARLRSEVEEKNVKISRARGSAQRSLHDAKQVAEKATELKSQLEKKETTCRKLAWKLCRRTDEVQALQERGQLLQHLLRRDEAALSTSSRDIDTLLNEVRSLRDEVSVLTRHVSLTAALKTELTRMHRELVTSQHKRSLLERRLIVASVTYPRAQKKVADREEYINMREKELLQSRLLRATLDSASAKLQSKLLEKHIAALQRRVARGCGHVISASTRSLYEAQLRTLQDHLKAAQAAANSAVYAREVAEEEKRRLYEQLVRNLQRNKLSLDKPKSAPPEKTS